MTPKVLVRANERMNLPLGEIQNVKDGASSLGNQEGKDLGFSFGNV